MIYFLLPAYNEAGSLPSLLRKLVRLTECVPAMQVVVVDDGSQDATLAVAEGFRGRLPLEVLHHPVNRGLGRAMMTGLRWIAERSAADDVIVTMDADDTHDPALARVMVHKLGQGYDVVIASRYQRGGEQVGLSLLRRVLSWGASWLLGRVFGIDGVRDYSSGFRAYRASVIQGAFAHFGDRLIETRGFDCMAELLLKLRSMNLRFGEVPMVLRYDRKAGRSKMPLVETVLQYFVMARRVTRMDERS
ncbi:glycosyltransferase [Heliophilum fasciatum]|uniref:Dolichol-phosphate mannosyltransferase n=1 Tax=Heliophilum fasciatum TaxID=35700 RepID=A0A4R2S7Q0_9FIRM|nr:glycosyltransferase [Heliophilum fasciatum]MCW2277429.1 dolichol-phosphate mannosyltransferase [Heliophilum fasciatum]TCP67265.1 dolichol-phosphate mannosyltransferase [Heliophilum fasciatum]